MRKRYAIPLCVEARDLLNQPVFLCALEGLPVYAFCV